eukprot:scaffold28898_cov74-Phaeocystis_antarctica.AAC.1
MLLGGRPRPRRRALPQPRRGAGGGVLEWAAGGGWSGGGGRSGLRPGPQVGRCGVARGGAGPEAAGTGRARPLLEGRELWRRRRREEVGVRPLRERARLGARRTGHRCRHLLRLRLVAQPCRVGHAKRADDQRLVVWRPRRPARLH